jgi:hypothetical protein
LYHAPINFSFAAAALTAQGQYVVVSRQAFKDKGAALQVAQVERDRISLADVSLPIPWIEDSEMIGSIAVDAARSTVWVSEGKFVAGYAVDGMSRGPVHRLAAEGSGAEGLPAPLLLRGNKLCMGAGGVINVWDVEEFDRWSGSEFSSSVMDHESASSYSDGETSPNLSERNHGNMATFSKSLHSAISKDFCRLCASSLAATGRRDCSECLTTVCQGCAHIYKLTSLGETNTRLICNHCIPSIRKRILSQQMSSRMPVQQQQQQQRPSSLLRKTIAPHVRQQVVKGGGERRVIGLLESDFSEADRLFVSFENRQCGLSWSMNQQREVRWYVGHTGAITCVASLAEEARLIATGSRDKSVKLWDSRARVPVASLEGHTSLVTSLCLATLSKVFFHLFF